MFLALFLPLVWADACYSDKVRLPILIQNTEEAYRHDTEVQAMAVVSEGGYNFAFVAGVIKQKVPAPTGEEYKGALYDDP